MTTKTFSGKKCVVDSEKAAEFLESFAGLSNEEGMALLCWGLSLVYKGHFSKYMTILDFTDGVAATIAASIQMPDSETFIPRGDE